MVPMGDWAKSRLKKLSETDRVRDESKVKSGFGKNISNWQGRNMAYPTNVLHFATECANKNHSAVFPKALPEWFIKLFTREYDWILDPFSGSGTTMEAAQHLNRNSVGIDIHQEYCQLAKERTAWYQLRLCEEETQYAADNSRSDSAVCGKKHTGISPQPAGKTEDSQVEGCPQT